VHESDAQTREEYHWGYMTTNWFAPACGYSLAPAGASGVPELQALVAALHRRGLAVLIDVVFNHQGVPPSLMAIDKLYYFEIGPPDSSPIGAVAATTCGPGPPWRSA